MDSDAALAPSDSPAPASAPAADPPADPSAGAGARRRGLVGDLAPGWALGMVLAWLAASAAVQALDQAPDDLQPPVLVDAVAGAAGIAMLAGMVALALRHRWGFVAAGGGGLASIGTVVWCATHLGVTGPLVAQVAVMAAMVAISAYGLVRTAR